MNRYILISGIFFISFMLAWPIAAYSTHILGHSPDPVVETTDPSEAATVPPTQSTADMDLSNSKSGDPLYDSLTLSGYRALKRSEDLLHLGTANDIMKGMLDAIMETEGWSWDEASQDYLPPGGAPDPARIKAVEASRIRSLMPPTGNDEWDFLPDYIPPDPLRIHTPWDEDALAPQETNPPQPQIPPSGESERSGSTRGELDLIVQ